MRWIRSFIGHRRNVPLAADPAPAEARPMVLPKDESPAATGSATPPDLLPLDSAAAKRALDDLFANAHVYRTGSAYKELLDFIARFRFYAPFNAVLIHTQRPGARFVAPAHRWIRDYRRAVKPGARPIVILQTMGPVMFVFDVSDTAGADLPADVADPFAVSAALGDATAASMLERLKDNAKRDGVAVVEVAYGSQRAGQIGPSPRAGTTLRIRRGRQGNEESFEIPERYSLHLNQARRSPPSSRRWSMSWRTSTAGISARPTNPGGPTGGAWTKPFANSRPSP